MTSSLALALLLAAPAAHPNSISSSRVEIEGALVRHELLLDPLSILEVLPGIDADGDGRIGEGELERSAAQIAEYVGRHYRFFLVAPERRELERRLEGVELAPAPVPAPPSAAPWVRMRSRLDAGRSPSALEIEVRLFFLTSPDHRDFCTLVWDGLLAATALFSEFEPRRAFARAELPFVSPAGRILSGARAFGRVQIAFLLALLLAAKSRRAALRWVLFFTLARWLGYGLGIAELVRPPERFAELCASLSGAFVGATLLLRREERGLGLEASAFGVVHGLALAALARADTERLLRPLRAELLFALGLEAAQLVLLLVLGSLAIALRRRPRPGLRRALALALVLVGLQAFLASAGWL